jgi:hypothetical protein
MEHNELVFRYSGIRKGGGGCLKQHKMSGHTGDFLEVSKYTKQGGNICLTMSEVTSKTCPCPN